MNDDNAADWQWLASTRHLQSTAYDLDYEELHGEKLADYLIWNHLALIDELHEFFQEIKWKTWANDRGRVKDRDAAVDELIDVGHFYANLLCALGVTDDEWRSRYQQKQLRNAKRQTVAGGYDTDIKKCPQCHRELDKPASMYYVGALETSKLFCARCDAEILQLPDGWAAEYAVRWFRND